MEFKIKNKRDEIHLVNVEPQEIEGTKYLMVHITRLQTRATVKALFGLTESYNNVMQGIKNLIECDNELWHTISELEYVAART